MSHTPESLSRGVGSKSDGGESTTPLDLYKLARGQVEHENTLVGQRITWYLTLQGFLFAAAFVAAGTLLGPGDPAISTTGLRHLTVAAGLMCFLGIASSVACFLLIRAACAQIEHVADWWGQQGIVGRYPAVTGKGGFTLFGYRVTGADFVLVVMATWVGMLFLLVSSALASSFPFACVT